MGTRVAGAAWRVCVAALVVALPIAATASAGAVTATSPSPAPTAASCYTPALFAYDAASYVYDGPARLSSPDTVATDARSSPSRPEVGSWEGAASVRDRGVAANTRVSMWDRFMAWSGREYKLSPNARIAPFGNRTGHPTGRFPGSSWFVVMGPGRAVGT